MKLRRRIRQIIRALRGTQDIPPLVSAEIDATLARVVRQAKRLMRRDRRATILYLPMYYMISYTRLLDAMMCLALELHGARVVPVIAGEDISRLYYFGGLYAGHPAQAQESARLETRIWKDILRTQPVHLDQVISAESRAAAQERADALDSVDALLAYEVDGFPVGRRAAEITANQWNMTSLRREPEKLPDAKAHAALCSCLLTAYDAICEDIEPDRVFSNVPYYYRWSTGAHVARRRSIPFYSVTLSDRKNSFLFGDDSGELQDITPAWPTWAARDLTDDVESALDQLIEDRFQGKTDGYSGYSLPGQVDSLDHARLRAWRDPNCKLAILPMNLLFDAAAYQPSAAFADPIEMMEKILAWFGGKPEFQLILKAHPVEKTFYDHPDPRQSVYTVARLVERRTEPLPPNVLFLDHGATVPVADLIPIVDLGIVYTSSTAMELSWFGKPVVSLARTHYSDKGFVCEPQSEKDCYDSIERFLTEPREEAEIRAQIETSRKYYWLYYYHARVDFKLIEGVDLGAERTRLLFDSAADLMPGRNEALDHVCDSIVAGVPILGPNRWPPATP